MLKALFRWHTLFLLLSWVSSHKRYAKTTCQPKKKIAFVKTHKTATQTLLVRSTARRTRSSFASVDRALEVRHEEQLAVPLQLRQ